MIDSKKCIGCGTCAGICPASAISFDKNNKAIIDNDVCFRCGACQSCCPVDAIEIE